MGKAKRATGWRLGEGAGEGPALLGRFTRAGVDSFIQPTPPLLVDARSRQALRRGVLHDGSATIRFDDPLLAVPIRALWGLPDCLGRCYRGAVSPLGSATSEESVDPPIAILLPGLESKG